MLNREKIKEKIISKRMTARERSTRERDRQRQRMREIKEESRGNKLKLKIKANSLKEITSPNFFKNF